MDTPTLARQAALPPRVASAIFATVGLIDEDLSTSVKLALSTLEQDLPQMIGTVYGASGATISFQHHTLLRTRQAGFMAALIQTLEASLHGIRTPEATHQQAARAAAPSSASWTLTEGDSNLVVQGNHAGKMAAQCKHPLYLLGNRFGVLAAAPRFDADSLPIGPASLHAAMHEASRTVFGQDFPHDILVEAVSRQLFKRYPIFLDRLNNTLDEAGILPGLTHIPIVRRARSKGASAKGKQTPQEAAPSTSTHQPTGAADQQRATPQQTVTRPYVANGVDAANHARQHAPSAAGGYIGPGSSSAIAGHSAHGAPVATDARVQGDANAQGASPIAPSNAPQANAPQGVSSGHIHAGKLPPPPRAAERAVWFEQAAADAGQQGQSDTQRPANPLASPTFSQVQALLARVHGRAGKAKPQPGSVVDVAPEEVHRVLDSLPPMPTSGPGRPRSIRHLHDQLKAQLKAEHGPNARLPRQHSDSLELLTMLYDVISREVRPNSQVVDLLGRMQLSLVRMALDSQAFFTEAEHPGRQLVSMVADSGSALADEGDVDPRFDAAVKHAVDRVETEYRGEEPVLREINEELKSALQEHGERSEAAEQHQIEAARGRERLTMAHAAVHELLDEKLKSVQVNRYLDMLIRTAWHDALTLVRLRNDEHSDQWKRHVRLTERMMEVCSAPESAEDVDLRESVTVALKRTGYHAEEASAIGRALSHSPAVPRNETHIPMTELAVMIKNRPRFGETMKAAEEIGHMPTPRTREEEEQFQYLRTLPFGTWFEFVVNQQGERRRRRLSWYSQVTGNALLVNRRGARVAEMQLDQMARLMAANQLTVVKQDDMRLIDRAWRATIATLESFGQMFGAGKVANA